MRPLIQRRPLTRGLLFARLFIGCCLLAGPIAATQTDEPTQARHGEVFFLRHALAPGSGDPPDMRLDDPSSQRNLSDAGRRQAREIGDALRVAGVARPRVFTSEWARCRETAELLGFGTPQTSAALNSFWERRDTQPAVLASFDELIAGLPANGAPVILVTHYVNIQAVTGRAVGSGEGFWITLEDLSKLRE